MILQDIYYIYMYIFQRLIRFIIFNLQVAEIGSRLESTAQHVEEKIVLLEQQVGRWSNLETEVASVKAWSVEAPVMVQGLHTLQATPQAKLTKAQQLQAQIEERELLIHKLSAEADDLITGRISNKSIKYHKTLIIHNYFKCLFLYL